MRLTSGMRKRAEAGELRKRLPVGLEYDEGARVRLYTDESVRDAIACVFRKFAELGSAHQVLRYLQNDGLLLPARRHSERGVRWIRPRYNAVRDIVTNPFYAGAYVYGRRRLERRVDERGHIRVHTRTLPRVDWKVVIEDHHPGYEYQPTPSDEPVYDAAQAAKELGVSHFTVLRWLKEGFLVGEQVARHAPRRIKLGPRVQRIVASSGASRTCAR